MKHSLHFLGLLFAVVLIASCQKENSDATVSCNNNVMRLKRMQATFDADHYIEATWNTNGTINTLKVNVPLSNYRTAKFIHENGKIKEAVLYNSETNNLVDTVVYHYNTEGRVDSMYWKHDDRFTISLRYRDGKIARYTRYDAPNSILVYWDIITDEQDNITRADEYWMNGNSQFDHESTMYYTRDARKNPLSGLAPYMMYLDGDYQSFWYWGPNSFTNQRYVDHGGTGIDQSTGFKFRYNDNCYPVSSQNTVSGQVILADDAFTYTYY